MGVHWFSALLSGGAAAALAAAIRCGGDWVRRDLVGSGKRVRVHNGGVVLLAAVLVGVLAAARHLPADRSLLAGLLACAGLCWCLGLFSDLALLPALLREVGVAACAVGAFHTGAAIASFKLPFTTHFQELSEGPALAVTVLWLLIVTKSFIATRGLPGLTTGLGMVVSFTLGVVALLQPQQRGEVTAVLAFTVTGACLGLALAGRRFPALPVGAAGAALLGFVVGVVTIVGALKNTAFLIAVLPLLVLGAPLLNTTYALAAGEGRLTPTRRWECLHDILLRQQVAPGRLAAWFIAIDAFLCMLAVLLVLLIEVHFAAKLLVLALFLPFGWLWFWSLAKFFSRLEPETQPEEIRLLDVRVTPVSMEVALDRLDAFILSRQPHQVVTSDSSAIVKAQTDRELFEILEDADLVTADGVGVIWGARILDIPLFERVPGVDLVAHLVQRGAEKGYRFYFLGSEPGVADEAARRLTQKHPDLLVVGAHHGYFSAEEEGDLVEQIRQLAPDVLLVALGVPRQEKWIRKHLARLQVPVCIGVGGTFDVFSGRFRRAPEWVQRGGLEWLYRALIDPSRLKRLGAIPQFILLTLKYRWQHRRG